MLFVEGEALLAGFEKKPLAQLQQKMFELVDDGRLEVGFGIFHLFIEPRNSMIP